MYCWPEKRVAHAAIGAILDYAMGAAVIKQCTRIGKHRRLWLKYRALLEPLIDPRTLRVDGAAWGAHLPAHEHHR